MSEAVTSVVWPLGNTAESKPVAQRKSGGLLGARVAFAWDYGFKGDKMWNIIRPELSRLFPGVSFFGPDDFGNIHDKFGSNDVANLELRKKMRELDISAAVVGVGA